jgi:glutathione peroxidase
MKNIILAISILFISMSISANETKTDTGTKTAYDFTFESIDGGEIKLSDYKGKPIMVVNTACLCGFTPQFVELEKLYQEYKDKGFVIVGVPSDDFGGQELDSEEEVKKYVDENFEVTFPLAKITKVKGDEAHPFYKWADDQTSFLGSPKWNFHKYIIDENGNLKDWYASTTSPISKKVKKSIEEILDNE